MRSKQSSVENKENDGKTCPQSVWGVMGRNVCQWAESLCLSCNLIKVWPKFVIDSYAIQAVVRAQKLSKKSGNEVNTHISQSSLIQHRLQLIGFQLCIFSPILVSSLYEKHLSSFPTSQVQNIVDLLSCPEVLISFLFEPQQKLS